MLKKKKINSTPQKTTWTKHLLCSRFRLSKFTQDIQKWVGLYWHYNTETQRSCDFAVLGTPALSELAVIWPNQAHVVLNSSSKFCNDIGHVETVQKLPLRKRKSHQIICFVQVSAESANQAGHGGLHSLISHTGRLDIACICGIGVLTHSENVLQSWATKHVISCKG